MDALPLEAAVAAAEEAVGEAAAAGADPSAFERFKTRLP